MAQTTKRREETKLIRTHARINRTPAQRLLDGNSLMQVQQDQVKSEQQAHHPFETKRETEERLAQAWRANLQLERVA
jgi:hypothetical protein